MNIHYTTPADMYFTIQSVKWWKFDQSTWFPCKRVSWCRFRGLHFLNSVEILRDLLNYLASVLNHYHPVFPLTIRVKYSAFSAIGDIFIVRIQFTLCRKHNWMDRIQWLGFKATQKAFAWLRFSGNQTPDLVFGNKMPCHSILLQLVSTISTTLCHDNSTLITWVLSCVF